MLPGFLKKFFSKKSSLANADPVFLGFWKDALAKAQAQHRPLFVLAPMADVTDCSFRKMINKYGKPDVTWTEFVSADGLMRATPEGKAKLMRDLLFNLKDENADGESGESARTGAAAGGFAVNSDFIDERPIVAQLFSSNPEYMRQAAKLVADLGFDGIDINMGCPDKGIEKQGCGSAMIKTPKKAQEIIRAAKEGGVREDGTRLPVSVKTRIGYNKNELETWLPALLEAGPATITIHARTRKEMSKVPARWEHVARAVEIRDEFFAKNPASEKTLILGNGDVLSLQDGYEKCVATKADGAMLGRAIFGNPWLFRGLEGVPKKTGDETRGKTEENSSGLVAYQPTQSEKLKVLVEHTQEFEKRLGDIKNFAIMKKHFKAYIQGFNGAKELRMELMEKASNSKEVAEIVDKFIEVV